MSNKGDITLIVPGPIGWETWEGAPPRNFTRTQADSTTIASEIPNLAGKDIVMYFPVRSTTWTPFLAATTDDALFPDLAVMHTERLGLRLDPMAGALLDTYLIEKHPENTALASVALRAPTEAELPSRSPKEFDTTPRAYAITTDAICLWKEFGYWVFAFYQKGKTLYAQATSNDSDTPDLSLTRDIKLALTQLTLQGLTYTPKEIRLWHPAAELGDVGALADSFTISTFLEKRPDPVMSDVPSKLLPADVHAARREAAKKRNIITIGAAAALIILGAAGYARYTLYQEINTTKSLIAQADAKRPVAEAVGNHNAKWAQLERIVDQKQWPLDILLNISQAIPKNSGMRLGEASITPDEIRLRCEATQSTPHGLFMQALQQNDFLASRFNLGASKPTQTPKGWESTVTGALPDNL